MTYVVTGGAGFIGSWVVDRLVAEGASVVALDNLTTGRSANLDGVHGPGSCLLVRGDARDRALLGEIVAPGDTLIHLAALVGVDRVCEDPLETYANNLDSTRAVLDVAAARECRVFVASTSEVYAQDGERPVAEGDPTRVEVVGCGRSAYAMAKLAGEELAALHRAANRLEVVVGRLFNTIGPRQRPEYGMVVPRFVAQAAAGDPITVFGDGTQTRSFCSVEDVARAIVRLCSEDRAMGEVFNIGGTEPVSIRALAEHVRAQAGSRSPLAFVARPPNRSPDVDATHRRPSIERIAGLTGWAPAVGWRDAVAELVARAVDERLTHALP